MTLDVWQANVLRHLNVLLMVCPPFIAHTRSLYHTNGNALDGVLEWTLPWSMDDGMGNVRLTLIEASNGWGKPLRVRVAVAAVSKPFIIGQQTIVNLPRYTENGDTSFCATEFGDAGLAHHMAAYLVEHVNGDADTLRADANGYWSFTVVVAEPYE
jgi:hypothetical protein